MGSSTKILPATHNLAFKFAFIGFRGSSIIWWIVKKLQHSYEGEDIFLPNGFPLTINTQDWTAKTIYEGTYERALLKFLATLPINDLLIDVGANIGVTLWHGMLNANLKAKYICFEPTATCQPHLMKVSENLTQHGEVLQKSVGEFDGFSKIYGAGNSKHSGSASLVIQSGLGSEVTTEVVRLDTILAKQKLVSRISLLKIDTEGYEPQVIRGFAETIKLKMVDTIIMEVTPGFADVNHFKLLEGCLGTDYFWFYLDESGFIKKNPRLTEILPESASKFPTQYNLVVMSRNTLLAYKSQKNKIIINLISS